jgi:hypothetical protein
MTIKTYDDIESFGMAFNSATVRRYDDGDVDEMVLGSLDLRREVAGLDAAGRAWELWRAGKYNSEGVDVLWVPDADRAGVVWGAGADWTDAASPQDALERYFGVDGKEMCE